MAKKKANTKVKRRMPKTKQKYPDFSQNVQFFSKYSICSNCSIVFEKDSPKKSTQKILQKNKHSQKILDQPKKCPPKQICVQNHWAPENRVIYTSLGCQWLQLPFLPNGCVTGAAFVPQSCFYWVSKLLRSTL